MNRIRNVEARSFGPNRFVCPFDHTDLCRARGIGKKLWEPKWKPESICPGRIIELAPIVIIKNNNKRSELSPRVFAYCSRNIFQSSTRGLSFLRWLPELSSIGANEKMTVSHFERAHKISIRAETKIRYASRVKSEGVSFKPAIRSVRIYTCIHFLDCTNQQQVQGVTIPLDRHNILAKFKTVYWITEVLSGNTTSQTKRLLGFFFVSLTALGRVRDTRFLLVSIAARVSLPIVSDLKG